jgi:hypothetical protein
MHVGVNGPAVEDEDVVLDEGIEVGPREELLGDVSPGEIINLGLPVVLEANHELDPMGLTRPEAVEAGIGQVG